MIDLKVKVKLPNIKAKPPKTKFWNKIGLKAAKDIRKRTEMRGKDVKGNKLLPYSAAYRKARVNGEVSKPGGGTYGRRSGTANLSLSGRMLGAIARGVRPKRTKVRLVLSGDEGGKAYANEKRGREFFDVSDKQAEAIARAYLKEFKL